MNVVLNIIQDEFYFSINFEISFIKPLLNGFLSARHQIYAKKYATKVGEKWSDNIH
jgi:hypothetical protein